MGQHRNILKRLRTIVLDHASDDHPDLAAMARDLGCVVHRDAATLAHALASLRQRGQGFEYWKLTSRARPALSVVIKALPPNYTTPAHHLAVLWGLEMSLVGALEVQACERDPATGDLRASGRHWLGPGDTVWFDADHGRTHRCRNLSRRETALSLHVHGAELQPTPSSGRRSPADHWVAAPTRPSIATRTG